jgi:hypothetical protein
MWSWNKSIMSSFTYYLKKRGEKNKELIEEHLKKS